MSSEAQISISNDDGVSDGPLKQDSIEQVRDVKLDLPARSKQTKDKQG